MRIERGNHIHFHGSDYEKYREELTCRVKGYLAQHAIECIIGISGDADDTKKDRTETMIEEFIGSLKGQGYAILTGGTEGGVPQIGMEIPVDS